MDATTRWETEAMRSSPQKRSKPPRPTGKRQTYEPGSGTFLTLKEAEEATGIPTNTLRKWVRKDAITSYLESDGETTLRMVEFDSVKHRARELGRHIQKAVPPSGGTGESSSQGGVRAREPRPPAGTGESSSQGGVRAREPRPPAGTDPTQSDQGGVRAREPRPPAQTPDTPEGSMLVPIDAWNRMLNQLGNLHEAGQQLAEARERAAKAETEALFLRERLAEIRSQTSEPTPSPLQGGQASLRARGAREPASPVPQPGQADETSQGDLHADETPDPATTSYWRYLTTGWRNRKKR